MNDDELTDWEKLQITYVFHAMTTGKVVVHSGDFMVLVDYPDRLNEHATPDG